ncbi:MAG: leucine-rich repeat domain-containing protein [Muribaculum sp.]|nr:leucine-rich repeat domain-containing protein [Muribaculum sp.]
MGKIIKLTIALVALTCILFSSNVSAQNLYSRDNLNFILSQTEPYEAAFTGSDKEWTKYDDIIIPEYVEHNGNRYSVVSISLPQGNREVNSLTLPSTIKRFEGEWEWIRIERINVPDIRTWLNISFPPKNGTTISYDKSYIYSDINIYCNPIKAGAKLYVDGKLATDIVIPEDITEIKDGAFYNATFIKSLDVKGNVTKVGVSSFEKCYRLEKVNIDYIWSWSANSFKKEDWLSIRQYVKDADTYFWGPKEYSVTYTNPIYYAHSLSINGNEVTNQLSFTQDGAVIGQGAFAGLTNLSTLDFKEVPALIASDSFYEDSNIRELILPSFEKWFERHPRTSLFNENIESLIVDSKPTTAIVVPDGIFTEIYDEEFKNFRILTSVIIGNAVKYIGKDAFLNCSNLGKLVLGVGVRDIYSSAFDGCKKIRRIYAMSDVPPSFIGERVFDEETVLLGTLYVPVGAKTSYLDSDWKIFENIEEIDFSNFDIYAPSPDPVALESDGLTFFLDTPVKGEATLAEVPIYRKDIDIPAYVSAEGTTYTVTTLGFKTHPYFESLTLPPTIKLFLTDWTKASSLKTITIDNLQAWLRIKMNYEEVKPEGKGFYSYAYIGNPLYSHPDIKVIVKDQTCDYELRVPSGIDEIYPSAFMNWEVEHLIFEGSIPKKIGADAFKGFRVLKVVINDFNSWAESSKLTEIKHSPEYDSNFPYYLKYYYSYNNPFNLNKPIYDNNGIITHIPLTEGVKDIADGAFANMPLTGISLPSSLETIGTLAFTGSGITEVSIPDGVSKLGMGAFYNSKLTKVTIPNSVKEIGAACFLNTSITEITIPNSVTKIEDECFSSTRIAELTIPNSVTEIGNNSFFNTNIAELTIPNSVTKIGNNSFYNTRITQLTVPDNVTELGKGCFRNTNLEFASIGEGITSIPEYAFYTSDLKEIRFGKNLKQIAYNSIYYSVRRSYLDVDRIPTLESIYIQAPEPPEVIITDPEDFLDYLYNYYTVLYVPKGSKSKYSEATFWELFINIEEYDFAAENSVDSIQTDVAPPFRIEGNTLIVNSDEIQGNFSICTIDGKVISRDASHNHTLSHGVYIIVCGNRSYKIAV